MFLESIDGKWKCKSVLSKCDECGNEYKATISTAERQMATLGVMQCRSCSSRRAGKKAAATLKYLDVIVHYGKDNIMHRPEVKKKFSELTKGRPFTEVHKEALRKPKSKTDKIKEAANRPEEVARRSSRMKSKNPMDNLETRDKMKNTIVDLYISGKMGSSKKYNTGWISNCKTLAPIWCRSGLEKIFLEKVVKNEVVTLVESAEYLRIPYIYKDTNHIYLPDFKLTLTNGLVVIVETKSSYFQTFEKDKVKMKVLEAYCVERNLEYKILNEKEIDLWLEELNV